MTAPTQLFATVDLVARRSFRPAKQSCLSSPAPSNLVLDEVRVARTMEEVMSAWSLVHDVYARSGLIVANRFGLHASRQAATSHAAVVLGTNGRGVVATATAILDSERGLPLDAVFPSELAARRLHGSVCEVGLFGQIGGAGAPPLVPGDVRRLMAHTLALAFAGGATEVVIGVHPRHARLYARMWGFELIARERPHPWVQGASCVLMNLTAAAAVRSPRAGELRRALRTGDAAADFMRRCRFEEPCARLDGYFAFASRGDSPSTQLLAA